MAQANAAAAQVLALVPACLQDMRLLEGLQAAAEGEPSEPHILLGACLAVSAWLLLPGQLSP